MEYQFIFHTPSYGPKVHVTKRLIVWVIGNNLIAHDLGCLWSVGSSGRVGYRMHLRHYCSHDIACTIPVRALEAAGRRTNLYSFSLFGTACRPPCFWGCLRGLRRPLSSFTCLTTLLVADQNNVSGTVPPPRRRFKERAHLVDSVLLLSFHLLRVFSLSRPLNIHVTVSCQCFCAPLVFTFWSIRMRTGFSCRN